MCLPILVDHPELLIEKGLYKNYEWIVLHNNYGYRCGYIKVLPDHPWYGMEDFYNIEVHGGITYTEFDKPCEQIGKDNGFWIGFDCCHGTRVNARKFRHQMG